MCVGMLRARHIVNAKGCCGWVDTAHPLGPAGHCAGAFSTHEFVATTCAMYGQRLTSVFLCYFVVVLDVPSTQRLQLR